MKTKLSEYYPLSDDVQKSLWRDAMIVLDTSVLLNLYHFSSALRDDLISLLQNLEERLWLPHQVGLEFHRGRKRVIADERLAYVGTNKQIKELRDKFSDAHRPPFLSDTLAREVDGILGKVTDELERARRSRTTALLDDKTRDAVSSLFANRVGDAYSNEQLEEAEKQAAVRYVRNIPPGYEDAAKSESTKFGDVLIWFQILKHAKAKKRGVIFVTDDRKSDWWSMTGEVNSNDGPLPELRREFEDETDQPFYMYTRTQFMEHAKKHGEEVKDESIDASKALDDIQRQKSVILTNKYFREAIDKRKEEEDLLRRALTNVSGVGSAANRILADKTALKRMLAEARVRQSSSLPTLGVGMSFKSAMEQAMEIELPRHPPDLTAAENEEEKSIGDDD